jgi:hypothetical protein
MHEYDNIQAAMRLIMSREIGLEKQQCEMEFLSRAKSKLKLTNLFPGT